MKHLFHTLFILLLMAACGQTGTERNTTVAELPGSDAKVKVYYFHGKQRCVTCVSAQNVTREAIEEHFPGNRDVAFIEVDFSERDNQALAEKYEIVFSSIIIANDTDYKDITDESFAMVMRNPEGLKSFIAQETRVFLDKS